MKTEAGKTVLERVRTKVVRDKEDAMEVESVDKISPLRVTSTVAAPYAVTAHPARQCGEKKNDRRLQTILVVSSI